MNFHISSGHFKVFDSQLSPRVEQVLKGIKISQARTKPTRTRLSITSSIMYKIRSFFAHTPLDYNNITLWAACCLAIFGYLRCSEFTIPNQEAFDETVRLSYGDISVDSLQNPQLISMLIKQSKTDPFQKGVTLMLSKTDQPVCPVTALLPYLAIQGSYQGPLFIWQISNTLLHPYSVYHCFIY